MSIKILAIGDVHLGRKPTRLPDALHLRTLALSPQAAWDKAIRLAIREQVDVVVLVGDVIESDKDYFEALPLVQAGVTALAEQGIRILMISGNHDANTLPIAAEWIDKATLLGQGGRWEAQVIETAEGNLTFWGWSFPETQYFDNPLLTLPAERSHGLHIGLLHCDRDQNTPYAPVTSRALADARMDVWLLGHVHQPDALSRITPSGYLGTLCGLDAGEPGPRGPWLITIEAGQVVEMTQRPIAPLRWERLSVDVSGVGHPAEVRRRLTAALHSLTEQLKQTTDRPEVVGIRLRYEGECDLSDQELDITDHERDANLPALPGLPDVEYFIEKVEFFIQPSLNLSQLALRNDQPGLLAQYLLLLERHQEDADRQQLLEEAIAAMAEDPEPNPEQVAQWLQLSAQRALRAMLSQQQAN